MTFTTLTFLFIFLPVSVGLYALIAPRSYRAKSILLILASLLFYSWSDVQALPVLIFSVVFNFATARLICAYKQNKLTLAKVALGVGVGMDALVLCLYKYTNLSLPLGISFYTFSAISYLVDIYRDDDQKPASFLESCVFITFFPKLLMGPIAQFKDFKGQLKMAHLTKANLFAGLYLFMLGMFKKVLLADQLGANFGSIYALQSKTVVAAWLGMIFYGLQLYFDFSGYSDMAIGLGRIFGFKIKKNFDYPYTSSSVSEFWRRWHISLGAWFKEYVYFPLGGNRVSNLLLLRNLCIVWLLTGIWHGSTWNFVVWGLFHGAFVVAEKFFLNQKTQSWSPKIRKMATCLIVFIGWVFFFNPSLGAAGVWLGNLVGIGASSFMDGQTFYLIYSNLVLLVTAIVASGPGLRNRGRLIIGNSKNKGRIGVAAVFALLCILSIAAMVGSTYSSFLYAKF